MSEESSELRRVGIYLDMKGLTFDQANQLRDYIGDKLDNDFMKKIVIEASEKLNGEFEFTCDWEIKGERWVP